MGRNRQLASCGSISPRIIRIIISAAKVFIRSTNLSPGLAGLYGSTQAENAQVDVDNHAPNLLFYATVV